MLDIIHVFFEDDMIPRWEQDAEIKSKVRSVLWRTMYKKEYKYGVDSGNRHNSFGPEGPPMGDPLNDGIYAPSGPGEIKPYIPPSTEDELFSILGAPMGE